MRLVLGLGIAKLFVVNLTEDETAALSDLIRGLFTKLEWSALTIPAAILLLALSLFLIKRH